MTSLTNLHIPVIDIGSQNLDAPQQLLEAATTYGFVFIENTEDAGIPVADIDRMFALSKEFFASSADVKEKCSIASNKAGKNHGWLSRGVEKLDPATQKRPDVKEAFNIGLPDYSTGSYEQVLPEIFEAEVSTLVDFQKSCQSFCVVILERFAQALEIDRRWFATRHDLSQGPSGTVFRLLYYPHVDDQEQGVDIRAGAHSDYGSITLLFQQPNQPGLEIKTPDGSWASVPVDPATSVASSSDPKRALPILVNFGDLLEDWTGGLLKSTVHRVVFPRDDGPGGGRDRYSMAYFCHPLDDARLEPVPSRIVQEYAARTGKDNRVADGQVVTAKEHLMKRLAATYSIK